MFTPNPVGDLFIVNDEGSGVRLLRTVVPAAEDIMLFGQAPCSAGRMKHRRVCCLGLLAPATNGQCVNSLPKASAYSALLAACLLPIAYGLVALGDWLVVYLRLRRNEHPETRRLLRLIGDSQPDR
jgi:hypothetical protein